MSDLFSLLMPLAGVAFPFVAMWFLWRRMKRVRDQVYHGSERLPSRQPWEEGLRSEGDLKLERTSDPNDELIALGDKAKHASWPLNNT